MHKMKKPILAIDIDDVLAKHTQGITNWHNAKYGTKHTENDYFSSIHWSQVWGVEEAEAERRAVEFHKDLEHSRFAVIEGSREALAKLAQKFDLVAVTIRRKIVVPTTYDWLSSNFAGLINDVKFVEFWETDKKQTKAQICLEIGATYLIDDSLEHCLVCADAGIPAIVYGDYAWNRVGSLPPNVTRAKDWGQILELLDVG